MKLHFTTYGGMVQSSLLVNEYVNKEIAVDFFKSTAATIMIYKQ